MKDKIYKLLPHFLQNVLVTTFDLIQYRKRHSGNYRRWRAYFTNAREWSADKLKEEQNQLLQDFIEYAKLHSPFYKQCLSSIDLRDNAKQYHTIPIFSKEDIRSNLDTIYTIPKSEAILSKTGGTTGKAIEVRFTLDDMQNRFALLDFFRSEWGYELGKKVAWFSGKALLNDRDKKRNRYWKSDFVYNIRYYSTFHINEHTARYYIDNLNAYKPLFAVGFPSSMVEIAKWGLRNDYPLTYKMQALFPTAETIVPVEREILERFFGGHVVNQYASSEGAPFIIECSRGNLHMELLSGFFEVLDSNNNPAQEGSLIFTSFTTHGTPLVRYNINDQITLSQRSCDCGNNNPLVEAIQGRINDFVYSKETGKINLGNLSNCVKYVKGIIKFQVIQKIESEIKILIVKDHSYTQKDEQMFLSELRERLGDNIHIFFEYVDDIPNEKSGKYRIVKQYLEQV